MQRKDFQQRFRSKPESVVKAAYEQSAAQTKRKGWQRICTVVPRAWELGLLDAKRVSTYRLAHELLYLHWYGKGKPIAVTGKVAQAAKISVSSKWNALGELERLGLIEVDRKPHRAPRVTLLKTGHARER